MTTDKLMAQAGLEAGVWAAGEMKGKSLFGLPVSISSARRLREDGGLAAWINQPFYADVSVDRARCAAYAHGRRGLWQTWTDLGLPSGESLIFRLGKAKFIAGNRQGDGSWRTVFFQSGGGWGPAPEQAVYLHFTDLGC